MMKCRFACRSTRNSIFPPLMSETALATSGVTVPVFGFGIRPRGPRTRPRRPTFPIMSGVAPPSHTGVGGLPAGPKREPAAVDALDELVTAYDVRAGLASRLRLVTVGE